MAWFGTSERRPFWEVPPFDGMNEPANTDGAALSQYGIQCVATQDFKGAISTGWAIWNLAGLDGETAKILLYEGYNGWSDEGATAFERAEFLLAYFRRLAVIHPEIPLVADVWALPPHVAQRASVYYGCRAWAASELCEIGPEAGVLTSDLRQELIPIPFS